MIDLDHKFQRWKEHLEVHPKRMSISTINIDLAEHVKSDIILGGGELLDLLLCTWLLPSKLVARKAKDAQTSSFRVCCIHLYQLPRNRAGVSILGY